ncbi:MAG: DUF1573 domain-containing protein [Verrucomicrobiales bacterium]|nr:DUF1573 domain-containing protein [Verrucomicrobiales bacterium]
MNTSHQKLFTYTKLLFALSLLAWLPAANGGAITKTSTQAKVKHPQTDRELGFDNTVFEHRAKPDEEVLHASFVMTNNTEQPVKITGLDTSCTCLDVRSDKKILAPGAKAKIEADFSLSKLAGTSEQFVYVKTDHPDFKELRLSVRVSIEPLFEIEPKMLSWTVGETPEEKAIKFKVLGKRGVNIVSMTSSKGTVSVDKKVIKEGRESELILKPKSTASTTLGMIRIITDSKIAKHRTQLVYFTVK